MARPLGNGSIRKVTRKTCEVWELNYRTREGKSRRRVLTNETGRPCRNKSEATRAQNKVIFERDVVANDHRQDWPWGIVLEQFLDDLSRRAKATHVYSFRKSVERILGDLGILTIGEISLSRVLAWRDTRRRRVSSSTCNHDTVAIRSFTKWLTKRQMIDTDSLIGLDPLPVKQVRPMRAFTDEELHRFFVAADVIDDDRLGTHQSLLPLAWVFRGLAETGMRYGEFRQVRWEDLEEGTNPTISVRANTAKNGRPRRLPIQPTLLRDLRAMRERQSAILGRLPSQSGPIWLSGRGKQLYVKSSSLMRTFIAVLDLAKIPKVNSDGESLVIHSFRHTHCTRLLRAGVAPQHVMQILGHRTQDMVMRVYNHMSSEDTRSAIECLPRVPGTDSLPPVALNGTGSKRG